MDRVQLNRLRWRCRRGLLELDIILSRFLAQHGHCLDPEELAQLMRLLELPENELLDLVMGRREASWQEARSLVEKLRAV